MSEVIAHNKEPGITGNSDFAILEQNSISKTGRLINTIILLKIKNYLTERSDRFLHELGVKITQVTELFGSLLY